MTSDRVESRGRGEQQWRKELYQKLRSLVDMHLDADDERAAQEILNYVSDLLSSSECEAEAGAQLEELRQMISKWRTTAANYNYSLGREVWGFCADELERALAALPRPEAGGNG